MAQVNWRLSVLGGMSFNANNFTFTTRTIGPNTSNSQAMVFVAPATGTYTRIVMQATAETIAGASTLIYGFQGITNASANTPPGIPDGTWISSNTVNANTFSIGTSPTVTNNFITLSGLSANLTKGTPYSLVIRPNTNWTAGYNITVRAAMANVNEVNNVTWYHLNGTTAGTGIPCYGIGTASTWYGYPAPFTTPSAVLSTTAGQANNQIGIEFSLPATVSSYKIRGWWTYLRMGFGTDPGMTVRILDASNNVLQTVTADTNKMRSTQLQLPHFFEFTDTLATLTGGTTYYLVVQTSNGSNNSMQGFTINSNFAPAWEQISHRMVYRNSNTGAWLSTTAPEEALALCDLVLEDVTTGGGGSTSSSTATFNPFSG